MLTQASKWTGLGLIAFLSGAVLVPGCVDSDSDDPMTGGTSNAGSGTGGDAGSGAKAGSGGGGGTSGGGSGGSGPQTAIECPGVVPTETLIADFDTPPEAGTMYEWGSAEKGDMDFWGGTFTYPTAIELAFEDGALTASGMVADYAGFGLYVTHCADASSFDGVRFKIKGDVPTGKLQFAVQTNRNEWANGVKGSCLAPEDKRYADCVHPSVSVDVTEELQTVEITWDELGGGKPAAAAKTAGEDVIGLQWILPWTGTMDPYEASVTIDDVELIGAGTGAGGSGAGGDGAGGSGTGPAAGGAGGAP